MSQQVLKVKLLSTDAILPEKNNKSDAGIDLFTSKDVKIISGMLYCRVNQMNKIQQIGLTYKIKYEYT